MIIPSGAGTTPNLIMNTTIPQKKVSKQSIMEKNLMWGSKHLHDSNSYKFIYTLCIYKVFNY